MIEQFQKENYSPGFYYSDSLGVRMEFSSRFLPEVSSVPLLSMLTQISLTVAAKELSVSDTDVSEVSWTDNGTFNLSEGYTPQTDTSDGMLTFLHILLFNIMSICKNIYLCQLLNGYTKYGVSIQRNTTWL